MNVASVGAWDGLMQGRGPAPSHGATAEAHSPPLSHDSPASLETSPEPGRALEADLEDAVMEEGATPLPVARSIQSQDPHTAQVEFSPEPSVVDEDTVYTQSFEQATPTSQVRTRIECINGCFLSNGTDPVLGLQIRL